MLLLDLSAEVADVVSFVVRLVDEPPEDEDVKAGWTAFAVFVLLGVAVAFLGWSLTRQLKKAGEAEKAGRFDPSDRPSRRTTLPREGDDPDRPDHG